MNFSTNTCSNRTEFPVKNCPFTWPAIFATLLFFVPLSLLPVRSLGEEKTGAVDAENASWKQLMALSTPDENHQLLASLVGSWNYAGREVQIDSRQKKTVLLEFKGTAVRRSQWNGRYFVVELVSEKAKTPWLGGHEYEFRGMQIEGYDVAKKKFFIATINNALDTGLAIDEGQY